jgi:hypothetical protein
MERKMKVMDLNEVWAKENEGSTFELWFGKSKYSGGWTVRQLMNLKQMRGYGSCTIKREEEG